MPSAARRPWPWGGAELSIEPVEPGADAAKVSAAARGVKSVDATVLEAFAGNAHWVAFILLVQAMFVAAALWHLAPEWLLLSFCTLVLLHGCARQRLGLRYLKDSLKDEPAWIRRLVVLSAINGAIWGGFAVVMAPYLPTHYRLLVLIVLTCLAAESGIGAITVVPRVWMAFLLPLLAPTVVYMLLATQSQRVAALAVVLAVLLLYRSRHQHYHLAQEQVALKAKQLLLQAALDTERQREADLLRNKTVFLEAVGHDLFQLVHGMGLQVRELRQGRAVSTITQELQRALDALYRYLSTIRDTVRVDTGTYICESFELPVQSVLERVVAEHQAMAADSGLDLRCRKSSRWIRSDPALIHSIISNFVSNAIRYTRSGRIVLGVRGSGNELRVEVWDSGIGICETELLSIFRDFYQVPGTRKAGAMGMGLPLVLRIARLLGATVRVRSAVGKGSCFAVSLPAAQRRPATTHLLPSPSAFQDAFEGKSVVLIDDRSSRRERTDRLFHEWKLAARAVSLDEAHVSGSAPAEPALDALIACLERYCEAKHSPVLGALVLRYRPRHTILILEQALDPGSAGRLRAKGLHVFYAPMPPWRLRMILWRLLGSH
jgi:signal transduction histidine kinase